MLKRFPIFFYLFKWLFISAIVGLLIGSVSAFFLVALNLVTDYREQNLWIIALLPLAGLGTGLLYHYFGKDVEAGSKQLMRTVCEPEATIPFKMTPFILFSTLSTHLFGGSAGREGTALQMGGSIADQLTNLFRLAKPDRKLLLIAGISAGFGSVFGTPLAGAIFSLEVFFLKQLRFNTLLPVFAASVFADIVTQQLWHVGHTHYQIGNIPQLSVLSLLYALIAGIIFGVIARLFGIITDEITNCFKSLKYYPLRPLIGGCILVICVWLIGTTRYIGLGIPVIVDAFNMQLPFYDFAIKLLFTALTLGAGYKGGEVTPLFFVGATLGSALSCLIPLPTALLAGMGFMAVFAGAANAPLTCTIMSIELFGSTCGGFVAIACITSYFISGKKSIYKTL